jgi:3-phosphoshikimate 1-carboxyvinyltransferase
MKVTITPSSINGLIVAPASKSSMQRACAAALLHNGTTILHNPGKSNDDLVALDIIQKLGAVIEKHTDESIIIKSKGVDPVSSEISCGESGLSIRMFTPIAALSEKAISITGIGSLVRRPMNFFDEIFPALGIRIQSNEGKLPMQIKGPLQPNNISIDGSLSSQFLTGLLMAFGYSSKQPVTITVDNLKSKPYIDLTLDVMRKFNLNTPVHDNYQAFTFGKKTNTDTPQIEYTVEGDWSGGSFLLVAGAIAGKVTVKGLDELSTQADKAILQALKDSGCSISISPGSIEVAPAQLKAFHFNATDCPDLFPPLVALASFCSGTTIIEGVSRLQHKESDRAKTLQEEFGKMGVKITLNDDIMMVTGTQKIDQAKVRSHHDHRIAMACAVAGLKADGEIVIEEADAINKSYPDFYKHLRQLGATIYMN